MLGIEDAQAPGAGSSLGPGMVGDLYRFQLTATGGSGGYVWALAPRAVLPPGLALDTGTGIISGTPLPVSQGQNSVVV